MKLKLFLDEDIHAGLAYALRQRGFDVVHAQDLKRKGKTDSEQLALAVREERCLVSFNIKDFVFLHNQYVEQNKEHWGIALSYCSTSNPVWGAKTVPGGFDSHALPPICLKMPL